MALNAAITCRAKLVSLNICRCGALTAVYVLANTALCINRVISYRQD